MRGLPFAASAFGAALLSNSALAGDSTLAETLFREGKALMAAKDYAAACPKLDESYRQDPATGTLLALAMCQEEQGKLASAWATYHSVVGRAEREGSKDRAAAAQRRSAALEPRLSYLTVQVPADVAGLSALVVTRDGVTLPRAAWGSATPTDPGTHVIEASADGKAPFRQTVDVAAEKDRKVVNVALLEAAAVAPADPKAPIAAVALSPAKAAPPQGDPAPATTETASSSLPLVGIVVAGAGVVALGVGTAFGLRAKDLDEQSRESGDCDPATGFCVGSKGLEANHDARAAGNVATALFIAGGALVAGGVTLYLVGSASDPSSASLSVSPLVALGGFGIGARGGF